MAASAASHTGDPGASLALTLVVTQRLLDHLRPDGPPPAWKGMKAGDRHYRAFVGPPEKYDLMSAHQFVVLISLGLREHHTVLDIGCGSLRAGRLVIPYLLPGSYFAVEPERWLIEQAVKYELGADLIRLKRPTFHYCADFRFSVMGRRFDFLLAQSIFSHAPQDQIRECLAQAANVMHAGSILAATYVDSEADYGGSDWIYPGIVRYRFNRIRELASASGLDCQQLDVVHPNGQNWVKMTPREAPAAVAGD